MMVMMKREGRKEGRKRVSDSLHRRRQWVGLECAARGRGQRAREPQQSPKGREGGEDRCCEAWVDCCLGITYFGCCVVCHGRSRESRRPSIIH